MTISDAASRQICFKNMLPHPLRRLIGLWANTAYYVAFGLFTLCSSIGWMSVGNMPPADSLVTFLQIITLILLLTKALNQVYSIKQLAIYGAGLAFLVAESRVSSSYMFVWLFLFVVSVQDIRLSKLAAVSLMVVSVMLITTLCSEWLGLTNNVQLVRSDGSIRSSLGFSHPNGFGLAILSLTCSWLTVRYGSLSKIDLIVPLIAIVVIMQVSGSRTTAIAVVIAAICFFLNRFTRLGRSRNTAPILLAALIIVSIIASITLMIVYDPSNALTGALNSLLSDRLYLANRFYNELGIHLLGTNTDLAEVFMFWGVPTGYLVDNAYCSIILRFGAALFIMFILILVKSIVGMSKANLDGRLLSGLTVYVIVGLMENAFFELSFNYYIIFVLAAVICGPDAQAQPLRGDNLSGASFKKPHVLPDDHVE